MERAHEWMGIVRDSAAGSRPGVSLVFSSFSRRLCGAAGRPERAADPGLAKTALGWYGCAHDRDAPRRLGRRICTVSLTLFGSPISTYVGLHRTLLPALTRALAADPTVVVRPFLLGFIAATFTELFRHVGYVYVGGLCLVLQSHLSSWLSQPALVMSTPGPRLVSSPPV